MRHRVDTHTHRRHREGEGERETAAQDESQVCDEEVEGPEPGGGATTAAATTAATGRTRLELESHGTDRSSGGHLGFLSRFTKGGGREIGQF